MIAFVLALVIIWIILGIVGFVVHGLFWLFIVACVLFIATLLISAFRRGRTSGRPAR